jgi:hypothetical protein
MMRHFINAAGDWAGVVLTPYGSSKAIPLIPALPS